MAFFEERSQAASGSVFAAVLPAATVDKDQKGKRILRASSLGEIEIEGLAGIVVVGVGEILDCLDGFGQAGASVPGAVVVAFALALAPGIAIGTDSLPGNRTVAVFVDAIKVFAEWLREFVAGELTILVLVPVIESGRFSED